MSLRLGLVGALREYCVVPSECSFNIVNTGKHRDLGTLSRPRDHILPAGHLYVFPAGLVSLTSPSGVSIYGLNPCDPTLLWICIMATLVNRRSSAASLMYLPTIAPVQIDYNDCTVGVLHTSMRSD